MNVSIEMYRISLRDYKTTVVCERCYKNGTVSSKCDKCGGKGTHQKTVKRWEICFHTENVKNIDRASKDSFYKQFQTGYEGGLRYWVSNNDYFNEEDRLLHFSKADAEEECNRRNKKLSEQEEAAKNV